MRRFRGRRVIGGYGALLPPGPVAGSAPAPPPFVPTDITGLTAWFDMADPASYTQAGTVTSITNKATAVAWTEATVPPAYDATALNGHPCMLPNGTNQRIISTEAAVVALLVNMPDFTLFFVGAAGTADAQRAFFGAGNSAEAATLNNYRFGTNNVGDGTWALATRNAAGTLITSQSAATADTGEHVFCFRREGTGLTIQVDNGAADPSATHNPGAITPDRCSIASRSASTPDLFWNGDWGELLVYDSALVSGDVNLVHDYLAAKWLA